MARYRSRVERRPSDYYSRRDDRSDIRSPRDLPPRDSVSDDYGGHSREPARRNSDHFSPSHDRDQRGSERERDRDRDGDIHMHPPSLKALPSKPSDKSWASSPHPAKDAGSIPRSDSKAPSTPTSHGADASSTQKQLISTLTNLLCEKSYWYDCREHATKKLKKIQYDKERLSDKRLEFGSVNEIWQQQLNTAEQERIKCKQKIELIDGKFFDALAPLLKEHRQSGQASLHGTPQPHDPGLDTPYDTYAQSRIRPSHEDVDNAELAKLKISVQQKADGEEVKLLRQGLDEERRKTRQLEERLDKLEKQMGESAKSSETRFAQLEARTNISLSTAKGVVETLDKIKVTMKEQPKEAEPAAPQPDISEAISKQLQNETEERTKLQKMVTDQSSSIKELARKLEPTLIEVERLVATSESQDRKLVRISEQLDAMAKTTEQLQSGVQEQEQKASNTLSSLESALLDIEQLKLASEKIRGRQDSLSEKNKGILGQVENIQHLVEEYGKSVQAKRSTDPDFSGHFAEVISQAATELPKLKQKIEAVEAKQITRLSLWEEKFNASFREQFLKLADSIGGIIENERGAREAMTDDVRMLQQRAIRVANEIDGFKAKLEDLEMRGGGLNDDQMLKLESEATSMKGQIDALATKVEETRNNMEMNILQDRVGNIEARTGTLATQVQGYINGQQDVQMQLAHMSDWANKFSSRPFFEQIVREVKAAVPSEMHKLEWRVGQLERIADDTDGINKRRKAVNGERVVIDGNA